MDGNQALLDRLSEAMKGSKPQVKAMVVARLESILAEIPFLEASLRDPTSVVKEIPSNRLLTPQEAGKLLNIPTRWLYRHGKSLPHRRFGKYLRFPERELLKWAEKQQNRTYP
jgi:excisionase family DNA binding protein